jgi:hypothetical protein
MMAVVKRVKNFVLYVDHDDTIAGDSWDDIVSNPITSLPKVLSPRKVAYMERTQGEKLPVFYSNLNKGTYDDGSGAEGSDNEDDLEFVDSGYDLEDDDDLFVDNVDEEVVDR